MNIKNLSKSLALAAPLIALAPVEVDAAAYIKFDGIDGESQYAGTDGYLKISYFKIEINGATTSANKLGDGNIAFRLDKASPRLMLACATGQSIENATIIFTKEDATGTESPYYKITFGNVSVKGYKSDRDADNVSSDQLTLGYTQIEWTYSVLSESGQVVETVSTGPLTRQ